MVRDNLGDREAYATSGSLGFVSQLGTLVMAIFDELVTTTSCDKHQMEEITTTPSSHKVLVHTG